MQFVQWEKWIIIYSLTKYRRKKKIIRCLYSALLGVRDLKINSLNHVLFLQEQSERLLVMYPSTLIILSEENDGLFYKVTQWPRWPLHVILTHHSYMHTAYQALVLTSHYYCRVSFHSIWSLWQLPAKTSSPTPLKLKVNTLNGSAVLLLSPLSTGI